MLKKSLLNNPNAPTHFISIELSQRDQYAKHTDSPNSPHYQYLYLMLIQTVISARQVTDPEEVHYFGCLSATSFPPQQISHSTLSTKFEYLQFQNILPSSRSYRITYMYRYELMSLRQKVCIVSYDECCQDLVLTEILRF